VILDLRPGSPTFKQWDAYELTAENRHTVFVPRGFAHGLLTLVDDTEITYLVSEFYRPESARGVRWDDPAFRIEWPVGDGLIISRRDREYPDFDG
jgi:dTDP-4-dehydrorhamnose 3,5-epimerase